MKALACPGNRCYDKYLYRGPGISGTIPVPGPVPHMSEPGEACDTTRFRRLPFAKSGK